MNIDVAYTDIENYNRDAPETFENAEKLPDDSGHHSLEPRESSGSSGSSGSSSESDNLHFLSVPPAVHNSMDSLRFSDSLNSFDSCISFEANSELQHKITIVNVTGEIVTIGSNIIITMNGTIDK